MHTAASHVNPPSGGSSTITIRLSQPRAIHRYHLAGLRLVTLDCELRRPARSVPADPLRYHHSPTHHACRARDASAGIGVYVEAWEGGAGDVGAQNVPLAHVDLNSGRARSRASPWRQPRASPPAVARARRSHRGVVAHDRVREVDREPPRHFQSTAVPVCVSPEK